MMTLKKTVEPNPPKYDDMQTALDTVNRYLDSKPGMKDELDLLYKLNSAIYIEQANAMKQTSITEFFS